MVIERNDYSKIDKLNKLVNPETFWNDVRKFTKNVHSSCGINAWQRLSESRFDELLTGVEDVKTLVIYGEPIRYFNRAGEEVFVKEEMKKYF